MRRDAVIHTRGDGLARDQGAADAHLRAQVVRRRAGHGDAEDRDGDVDGAGRDLDVGCRGDLQADVLAVHGGVRRERQVGEVRVVGADAGFEGRARQHEERHQHFGAKRRAPS